MAKANVINIAALSPISIIEETNTFNTVNGKAVADYVANSGGGGGGGSYGDDIICNSIVVKGNSINWASYSTYNLNLGSGASITGGEQTGNVLLGSKSSITDAIQRGNVILGSSSIIKGSHDGNVFAGSNATISGSFYGNIIAGTNANITNLDGEHGNIILGDNSSFGGTCTTTKNTIIIGSYAQGKEFEDQITTRRGLVLIGTQWGASEPYNTYRYRVYWPSANEYAAEQHGWLKCMADFNLLNADGEYIIQNGKLIGGSSSGNITIVDEVTEGNNNAVTSNAVAKKIEELKTEVDANKNRISILEKSGGSGEGIGFLDNKTRQTLYDGSPQGTNNISAPFNGWITIFGYIKSGSFTIRIDDANIIHFGSGYDSFGPINMVMPVKKDQIITIVSPSNLPSNLNNTVHISLYPMTY